MVPKIIASPQQKIVANKNMTPILEWYKDKSIFITGATGFMGKVLIEKILRSIPTIKNIYILVRVKRQSDPKQRLQQLLNCPIFDNIKQESPDLLNKVISIDGDVLRPELGLNNEDLSTLRRNVSVIFHFAATVRFDQKLKSAVNLNIGGTLRVLEVVETFDNIDVFCHVSTAYCNCHTKKLEEIMYPSSHPPESVLDMCQWMTDEAMDQLTPTLLDYHPNTYSYTKYLAETLVNNYSKKFPICITRPSIVTAALKEPIPGWIESLNGPTGLIVGAGKGVIRSMLCYGDYLADIIPVDLAINGTIISAWYTAQERPKETFIVNLTQSQENALTWAEALKIGRKHILNNPYSVILWYPDGSPKKNKVLHFFSVLFLHFLPAFLVDGLLVLLRRKPFLVQVQNKIQSGLSVLQYYTTTEWIFFNSNLKALSSLLNEKERKIFYTDINEMEWDNYMYNYIMCIRKYIAKEDPKTLPSARNNLKRWYYINYVVQMMLMIFVFYILYHICSNLIPISNSRTVTYVLEK